MLAGDKRTDGEVQISPFSFSFSLWSPLSFFLLPVVVFWWWLCCVVREPKESDARASARRASLSILLSHTTKLAQISLGALLLGRNAVYFFLLFSSFSTSPNRLAAIFSRGRGGSCSRQGLQSSAETMHYRMYLVQDTSHCCKLRSLSCMEG